MKRGHLARTWFALQNRKKQNRQIKTFINHVLVKDIFQSIVFPRLITLLVSSSFRFVGEAKPKQPRITFDAHLKIAL